jgi:Spy/CpxP family protein refolding chaperone
MNRFPQSLFALVATVCLSSAAIAGPHAHDSEAHFERLSQELALTDAQRAPVKAIFDAVNSRREARREAEKEARDTERLAIEAELDPILDDSQMTKLRALADRREGRREHRHAPN